MSRHGAGGRQIQGHTRQIKDIREGAFRGFGVSADGETREEGGRSQPGSNPGEDSNITGKCAGGRLWAGKAPEGCVQGSKGVDTGFQ